MSPDELDALRERADQAFEREGPERARELYRSLPFADVTHDDFVRLLDAEAAAMLLLLRTMWRENKGWYVGFTLADHTDKDDAIRVLGTLPPARASAVPRSIAGCSRPSSARKDSKGFSFSRPSMPTQSCPSRFAHSLPSSWRRSSGCHGSGDR
jgi:hypothetical protein